VATPNPLIFIECHYYSSGLKSIFSGDELRPKWLPPIDAVGLHNEAELKGDDCAMEFTRFEINDRKVSWLAIYKCAKDEDYGDRGNYRGVGVWFVDSFPSYPTKVLGGLLKLCNLLQEYGINSDFEPNLPEFLDFLKPLINPVQWLPSFAVGMRYGKESAYSLTNYVKVPGRIDFALGILSSGVQRLLFASRELPFNRIVFWVGSEGKLKVDEIQDLASFEESLNLEAFVSSILRQNSGKNDADFRLRNENGLLQSDNERLQRAIESVQQEVDSLVEAKSNQERVIGDLRSQNDELRSAQRRLHDSRADVAFRPLDQKKGYGSREVTDKPQNNSGISNLAQEVRYIKKMVIEIKELVEPSSSAHSFQELLVGLKDSKVFLAVCSLVLLFFLAVALMLFTDRHDRRERQTMDAPIPAVRDAQPSLD